MCVVSMVIDHYRDKWTDPNYPWTNPSPNTAPNTIPWIQPYQRPDESERIRRLEEEVAELKRLLERAKEYDDRNNEPDCELQEKVDALKRIAKERGIDISGAF